MSYFKCVPTTAAARSKAWIVFASLNAEIVGTNSTQNMDVFVRLFCVYKKKLRGFSPQANYTDRAIAADQRS
jgi:hypothetical protein